MWKRRILLASLGIFFFGCLSGLFGGKGELSLEKTQFEPGEAIAVHFKAPASFKENAWVGLIPSDAPHGEEAVNDQNDLAYQYLRKQTQGTLTFNAPTQPGSFDFRMNDTDDNGKEVASVSFTVVAPPAPAGVSISLNKSQYAPGESIQVSFTALPSFPENAWIGIIPAEIEHGSEATDDQHDLAYQYLKGSTQGTLTFTAPDQPGTYDFRMHDTDADGKEVIYVTFTVK